MLRLTGALAVLRANLTLGSAAMRHALRLAVCVFIGGVVSSAAGWTRAYWCPMTIAIVLKPDFTATFSRGILRVAGTLAGLAFATGLVHVLSPSIWVHVALIGAFAMASINAIDRQGRVLVISGLAFCIVLAAFVLCPLFWPGVVLLVLVGIAATVFSTMIATMIQLRVPGELRGRVISLYTITLIGLPSLGALGVAALANTLSEGRSSVWSRPLLGLLDMLGVNRLTNQLGAAAGTAGWPGNA